MLFVISCIEKLNTQTLNKELKQQKIDYFNKKFNEGMIALTSPLFSEDAKTHVGNFLILEAPDLAAAQAFLDADPYTRAGVFSSITIHCIHKGRWNPALIENARRIK